jgi:hypothetical protein
MLFELLVLGSVCWNAIDRPTTANVPLVHALRRDGIIFFMVKLGVSSKPLMNTDPFVGPYYASCIKFGSCRNFSTRTGFDASIVRKIPFFLHLCCTRLIFFFPHCKLYLGNDHLGP